MMMCKASNGQHVLVWCYIMVLLLGIKLRRGAPAVALQRWLAQWVVVTGYWLYLDNTTAIQWSEFWWVWQAKSFFLSLHLNSPSSSSPCSSPWLCCPTAAPQALLPLLLLFFLAMLGLGLATITSSRGHPELPDHLDVSSSLDISRSPEEAEAEPESEPEAGEEALGEPEPESESADWFEANNIFISEIYIHIISIKKYTLL